MATLYNNDQLVLLWSVMYCLPTLVQQDINIYTYITDLHNVGQ